MADEQFDATLWTWTGNGAQWVFVTLPEPVADRVEGQPLAPGRGFGAVKVRVTIGASTWDTSVFPSKEHASYILPIKAAVRRKEVLDAGDRVTVTIVLIDP